MITPLDLHELYHVYIIIDLYYQMSSLAYMFYYPAELSIIQI